MLLATLALFLPSKTLAADELRVSGFAYPRSKYPLVNPGNPRVFSATMLYSELSDPNNFGAGATVECPVEFNSFMQTIEPGSLVSIEGNILYDIFFAGFTNTDLTTQEATELASFIKSGGIVYASVNPEVGSSSVYNKLFTALGINDRFTNAIDNRYFRGYTTTPEKTPITSGKFGTVDKMVNYQFYLLNQDSLEGITKGFNEPFYPGTMSVDPSPNVISNSTSTDTIEYLLYEKEFGSGYLSLSGSIMYLDTHNDNLKYFKNLFGYACRDVLGTSTQPFLELPWDYRSMGMSFSEAALAINSYFDHEYPLLSTSLVEPAEYVNRTTTYRGEFNSLLEYSRHDGYDWGSDAKTIFGEPQLAAADGIATFHNNCIPCGNAIYIDHQNGFQTRYYHLNSEGLVTNNPNQSVSVDLGQQIGLTGFTGNVRPKGEAGSHIHFMVIEDKDGDGNFNDNIPDGLVDPYGWQSNDPDPWPSFSFFYNGQERTGNTSRYLWLHDLIIDGKNAITGGEVVEIEGNSIEFPENASEEPFNVRLEYAQYFNSGSLASIGPIIKATATSLAGELIDIFDKPFKLQMEITDAFLENIDLSSLAIWSSEDGESWTQADTEIDWNVGTATAYFGHFSYFALMGEPIDTTAPVTTIVTVGHEGESGWFRSNIELSLTVIDESDIQYTAFKINDGEWKEYMTPQTLTEEGTHTIQYYSEDEHGNLEEINTTELNIDKQSPELLIHFSTQAESFEFKSLDVNSAGVKVISGEGTKVSIEANDKAGNSTTLSGHLIKSAHGELLIPRKVTTAEIVSEIFETWVKAFYKTENNLVQKFIQTYNYPYGVVKIEYYSENNSSQISEKVNEDEWTRTIFNGTKILTIQTNKGTLEFSYQ